MNPATQVRVGLKFVGLMVIASLVGTAGLIVFFAYFVYTYLRLRFGATLLSGSANSAPADRTDPTNSAETEPLRTVAQVANDDVIEALEQEIATLSRQYEELMAEVRLLRNYSPETGSFGPASATTAKAQKKATKLEAQAARINTRRMKLNEQLLKRQERY